MPQIRLDLSEVEKILDEAYIVVKEHNGSLVDVDYDRGRTRRQGPSPERAQMAAVARDLMRLSELLAAAGGIATLKYWEFKGFQDPRTT